jgi:hypothetical protein
LQNALQRRRRKSPNEISTWERPCFIVASWDKGVYV